MASRAITPIATALTSLSAIGTQRTSNCDAAKIHATCRTESERLARPTNHQKASAIDREHDGGPPVQDAEEIEQPFDRGDPERDAHPPLAKPAAGTAGTMLDCGRPDHANQPYHAGTVTQTRPKRRSRRAARVGVRRPVKEAVDGRAGAADVGAKGALREQLAGERRRCQIVRRQGGEVARAPHPRERCAQGLEAVFVAALAPTLVERRIDLRRRPLRRAFGSEEQDDEVLRQIERLEHGAVAGPELRPVAQEERHVRPDPSRELVQLLGGPGDVELLVGEPQRGRRVRAATAEPGRDRGVLLDPNLPAVRRAERIQRRADDRVPGEAGDRRLAAGPTLMRSPRSTRW